MKAPFETEEDEESDDEGAPSNHSSNIMYAVIGGAMTLLSAFAFYKARNS